MATLVTTLENSQEMEVVVSGSDGANRLIICSGIVPINQEAESGTTTQVWKWRVGPVFSNTNTPFRRAIVDGAFCRISQKGGNASWSITEIDADWNDDLENNSGQVEVTAEVNVGAAEQASTCVQGISYHVSILLALPVVPLMSAPDPNFQADPLPVPDSLQSTTATDPTLTPLNYLYVEPAVINFGSARLGTQTGDHFITVTEAGIDDNTLLEITLTGPNADDFIVTKPSFPYPDPRSVEILISFRPTSLGEKTAVIRTAGVSGSVVQTTLSGIGVAEPARLILTPSNHVFDALHVGATSADASVTISNNGNEPTGPLQVSISGTYASEFMLIDPPVGRVIAAGASTTFRIRFAPTSVGDKKDTFVNVSSMPGGSATLSLIGYSV